MEKFEVGDLVKDTLNEGDRAYGLGVVVATESVGLTEALSSYDSVLTAGHNLPGKRYDVYFTKFERTITFHGDYLEKV